MTYFKVLFGVLGFVFLIPPPLLADTLIKNATIMDGSGKPSYLGDVRVSGDKITAIGNLNPTSNDTIIDAKGLALAPGFIDTHSHHDWGLENNREALAVLTQGITTSIFGQDGGHNFPLLDTLERFKKTPPAMNFASYVGHNTLREIVMGEDNKREATLSELEAMKKLLITEMAAGAIGLSTGLEYEPGIYSHRSEVIELAKVAASLGGRYISHIRSEDRYFWDSIDEIIDIGRITKIPVQISHIKLAAKEIWGQSSKLITLLNEARAEGISISADIYPYEYWQSTLWVLLPERDADDFDEIKNVLDNITPADGIIFMAYGPDPSYVGKSLSEIAKLRGVSEVEAFSTLLKESDRWQNENGAQGQSIMGKSMINSDIAEIMKWPHTNISSDGGFEGHPRGYGAFPRFINHFVKGMDLMTMEVAIRHMTSLAAKNMGISNRGEIKVGHFADLVLFNQNTLKDNATLEERQRLSTGVEMVWVNGSLVLNKGMATHNYPGRVLK